MGITTGRLVWTLFVAETNAVPALSVPVRSIMAISIDTLVLADLVAAAAGRIAARTKPALLLRAG